MMLLLNLTSPQFSVSAICFRAFPVLFVISIAPKCHPSARQSLQWTRPLHPISISKKPSKLAGNPR